MSTARPIGEEPEVFAHQVRALRARQRREDDEAIGGFLNRAGFRAQGEDRHSNVPHQRSGSSVRDRVDFHAASPLTRRDRQTDGVRVPHFDVKAVVATHPPSRNGVAQPRCGGGGMGAAAHFKYVTDGARIGLATHIDYIRRETGVADPAGELLLDMLDEQEMRAEKNRLACFTNIPGGWGRARNLFEATERAAPQPKSHLLHASTAQLADFEAQFRFGVPVWFRRMTRRLRAEADKVEQEAGKRGHPVRQRTVTIAEVSNDEACDRLDWFEHRPFARRLVSWKQGRTQRSQHRFVGELPDGISAIDRHEILSRFCGTLAEDGWMVVGAIHQPDRHNDRRNFHIHVDGVDRPAEWLDEHGCWDFEYVERRNGKDTRPYRQNKVRYEVPPAGIFRERFITIVNEVVGDRPDIVRYLHGTYADNGIALTPLEHMGNRAIGFGARGIETEVGSRNARRILADGAAACEKRANEAEAALASEVALSRFDDKKRNRLHAWLGKYAGDGDLLIFKNGKARLGRTVPKAIDTLMRQFAHEPRFQLLLLAEQHRRADRGIISSLAPPRRTRSAPSVMTVRTLPVVASVASSTSAPQAHLATPQVDREPDHSDPMPSKLPDGPNEPDRLGATAPRGASTNGSPPMLDLAEKSKGGVFDQASSLPTVGAKRVASKGPARSAAPVAPRTKWPER